MRYVIHGAGAVGGITGSLLFRGGIDVVLIARGAHFEAIRDNGLRLETPEGAIVQRIPVVSHPSQLSFTEDDVVLLAVKTQDSEAAMADLEAAAGSDIPLFCVQNGVENERRALRRFNNVYGVHVTMPADFLTPGTVTASAWPSPGVFDVGRYPQGTNTLVENVVADLQNAGFGAAAREHVMRWKYTKLLQNLVNGLQALLPEQEDFAEVLAKLRNEALAVYEAAGIEYAGNDEMLRLSNPSLPGAAPRGGGRRTGSTWQSVARGTGSVEVDFLNGEIVAGGRQHGISTPYNEAVRRLTNKLARNREAPNSVPLSEIVATAERLASRP